MAPKKLNMTNVFVTPKILARYGPPESKESIEKRMRQELKGKTKKELFEIIEAVGHRGWYVDLAHRQLGPRWDKLPKERLIQWIAQYPHILKLNGT